MYERRFAGGMTPLCSRRGGWKRESLMYQPGNTPKRRSGAGRSRERTVLSPVIGLLGGETDSLGESAQSRSTGMFE